LGLIVAGIPDAGVRCSTDNTQQHEEVRWRRLGQEETMDAESFDRLTRGLNARLARRGLGRTIAAGVAALSLSGAADAKKKKKKKKKPPAGCIAPNVACGTACCPPGEPCVDGRCGCAAGEVYCDLGDVAGCLPGNCCPETACAGETCCPAGTMCLTAGGGELGIRTACRCITRFDDCAGRCCPTGQACYDGACGPCRPGSDRSGLTVCGPQCLCVTSVENAAACIDATLEFVCSDCESDAECSAQLQRPAICFTRPGTEQCPSERVCAPIGCPDS
jgi:hypothetical protein